MTYRSPSQSSSYGQFTLDEFIQTVLVGISGLTGPLVRPKWQIKPAPQPAIEINWMAYGIETSTPDANSFTGTMPDQSYQTQRHDDLEVACSFYGPNALDFALLVRDGFQLTPNLDALRSVNMGFVEVSRAIHLPELINEIWFNRYEMSVHLRREMIRTYPIVTLVGANGTLHGNAGEHEFNIDWKTQS